MKRAIRLVWQVGMMIAVYGSLSVIAPSQTEKVLRVDELGMRKSALKTVMPSYPEQARRHKAQGVAVAEVQYNGKGEVTEVQVLESPDAAVIGPLTDALKQWKFGTTTVKGNPVSIRGKLTFYYVLDKKGRGRVENPRQFKS